MEGAVNARRHSDHLDDRDGGEVVFGAGELPPALHVCKATIECVHDIKDLVNRFADRGEMLHRPLSEIYENLRDYFVVTVEGRLVGCCALHINWADLVEIKALAVAEDWQRKGIGGMLIQACLHEAREIGLPTVYALTSKPEVFEKSGFSRVDVSSLPHKVWGECYRCVKFGNCDEVAVVRNLALPDKMTEDM